MWTAGTVLPVLPIPTERPIHLKREHRAKDNVKKYFVSEEVYYDCLMYKKPLLHETKRITDNKLNKHALNLATYGDKCYFPSLGAESSAIPKISATLSINSTMQYPIRVSSSHL